MNRAFTLIELLIVIAIIAVVAAIIFPVYSQAKKRSTAASDISNLRQIGLAASLYQDEHETVPLAGYDTRTLLKQKRIEVELLRCETDPTDRGWNNHFRAVLTRGGRQADWIIKPTDYFDSHINALDRMSKVHLLDIKETDPESGWLAALTHSKPNRIDPDRSTIFTGGSYHRLLFDGSVQHHEHRIWKDGSNSDNYVLSQDSVWFMTNHEEFLNRRRWNE
ncbi:MAG: type II secretion system protein [Fimbriimonadaceae bacterium]